LCSRHFTEDSYIVEGQQYHDDFGIPAQKRLKADTVLTVIPKPDDQLDTSDSKSTMTPRSHPLSERREQRLVGSYMAKQIL